ncbi:MAG: hypothetical protein AAF490_13005 [Chloroflexota bacterium]
MSNLTIGPQYGDSLPTIWRKSLQTSRWLSWLTVGSVILFLLTIFLNIVDSRVVTGAPVWIKPMKFAISITLYSATMIWMLGYIKGRRRLVNVIAIATTVGFLVEYVAIFIQAARGVRSHFNLTTPFDATLFGLMANFVIVIWVMNVVAGYILLRQKMDDKPFAWSLRLGLIVTAVGSGLGFLMTAGPTPTQLAALEAGEPVQFIGAHSVGVEDGGPGLPLTNWSVEGGDIRVPHFIGMHALQIIPILGIVVNHLFKTTLSERRRTTLVWIGGLGYLGVTLILLWQALRGQPVIAPDSLTLAAFGILFGTMVISTTAVFATNQLTNQTS